MRFYLKAFYFKKLYNKGFRAEERGKRVNEGGESDFCPLTIVFLKPIVF
jgi:hypothetical protein